MSAAAPPAQTGPPAPHLQPQNNTANGDPWFYHNGTEAALQFDDDLISYDTDEDYLFGQLDRKLRWCCFVSGDWFEKQYKRAKRDTLAGRLAVRAERDVKDLPVARATRNRVWFKKEV